jgi:hypothetical protein
VVCVCVYRTIQGQDLNVNVTCCESNPTGYEGIGIVKMLVNTSKHPPHYWGGWVPATITIKSDTLITATAFLPQDVNATLVEVREYKLCSFLRSSD